MKTFEEYYDNYSTSLQARFLAMFMYELYRLDVTSHDTYIINEVNDQYEVNSRMRTVIYKQFNDDWSGYK